MPKKIKKLMTGSRMPPSGTAKEASGVAQTTAEAATVMGKVAPKAIHQTVEAQGLPTFLEVAIPGDHEQHDPSSHGGGARSYGEHDRVRRDTEEPDEQGRHHGQAQRKDREDDRLGRIG
jgi:hypothetical protein